MNLRTWLTAILFLLLLFTRCNKPDGNNQDIIIDEEIISPPNSLFWTSVPRKIYDIILVRPTVRSVTLSILSYKTCDARIEYWVKGSLESKTVFFKLSGNVPKEIILDGLEPSAAYEYYYSYKLQTSDEYVSSPRYSFQLGKGIGHEFSIAIMADSHLDMNTDTAIYKQTLENIKESDVDFIVDLGDTFMNDKYGDDISMALYNYLAQRYYFGSICHSIPLNYVQGNHDGEYGRYYDGTSQSNAVWSNQMRKKYFPMPEPGDFYSGNKEKDPFNGYLQDYYAWQWADALFIVLDPFWYSPLASANDPWARSLGETQYKWLEEVLKESDASFKFVLIHHLVGGFDVGGKARGGAEAGAFYEWGGQNLEGTDEFATRRPGWELPIHDLLVKYSVDAVFHGHDHFYAFQEKDGIVYQEIPQPSVPENSNANHATEYGYLQGTILGGTGCLRLTVSSTGARVEYIGTSLSDPGQNKRVIHQFLIN